MVIVVQENYSSCIIYLFWKALQPLFFMDTATNEQI